MNPAAAQLRDIHLPQTVDWWPPAPGWWLLGTLLSLLVLLSAGYAIRHWRRGRAKRQALAALADAAELQAINMLLKRAALAYFDRTQVAPLHGQGWLRFLDTQLPAGKPLFARRAGLWQQLLYGRQATPKQLQQFRLLAGHWLKHALPPARTTPLQTKLRAVMSYIKMSCIKRRRSQGA